MNENNFGQDVEFLQRHVETLVLTNKHAQIAVVPQWQGRTMTSCSAGHQGTSYGYINYDHIASGKHDPQINLYGGEDRMWISPEGGQFSVFFDPGDEFSFSNWRTPALLDTEPFELVGRSECSLTFTKRASLTNRNRFEFAVLLDRTVMLHPSVAAAERLGIALDGVNLVFHESHNTITNVGEQAWCPETGLLGVWMLCMNKPSRQATLLVPFQKGSTEIRGPIVNADYFGKLDTRRLVVDEDAGLIYFLGDGQLRSKLGLTFDRATSRLGSWDRQRGVLSIVEFNLPSVAPQGYSNNLWQIQETPYAGDVINCYNDGPNDSGGKLGGFFELETLGPALALGPLESYTHQHRTMRLEGRRETLDSVAKHVFGVGLDQIESRLTESG